MGYRLMGWTAYRATRLWDRATQQRGQGTVEYIGIVVMVAVLAGAVALVSNKWAGGIGDSIKKGLVKAIDTLVSGIGATK